MQPLAIKPRQAACFKEIQYSHPQVRQQGPPGLLYQLLSPVFRLKEGRRSGEVPLGKCGPLPSEQAQDKPKRSAWPGRRLCPHITAAVTEHQPERALLFVPARHLPAIPASGVAQGLYRTASRELAAVVLIFFFLFKKLQIVNRPLNSISPLQQTHIKIITLLGFEIPRELPELQPSTAVDNAKGMHGRLSRREDEMINHSG